MLSALSSKAEEKEIIVLDSLTFEAPKTKEMIKVLENVQAAKKALIVTAEKDENVVRSAANIPGVRTALVGTMNVYEIINHTNLILTADAVKNINKFEIHYNRDPDLRFVQAAQATDGKLSLDIDLGVLCWQLCTAATDFYKAHQSECSKATIEIEDTTPSEDERKALRKLIEEKCGYTFEELKEMKRKDPSFKLDFDFLK